MDLKSYLTEKRGLVDAFIESHFSSPLLQSALGGAMTYSLFAGGKRIRPILAIASHETCGGRAEDVLPYAASLELIHTYSLIHDDLPAMDDDDLRRGKPTNHKVFGEGMAILAGDALLTEAFYLLSSASPRTSGKEGNGGNPQRRPGSRISPAAVLKVIREVAMAGGAHGMVGGQAEDLRSENAALDEGGLAFIHTHKTGALITASIRIGAILANARKREVQALTRYGENVGLAFQIIDDILDVRGNTQEMGKKAGSDERKQKMTYPALYGIDSSVRKAEELVSAAVSALELFPETADPLREIARYLLKRRN